MEYPGDATFTDVAGMVLSDYRAAKREHEAPLEMGRWIGRVAWDIVANKMTSTEAIMKSRKELRVQLGLRPLT